MKLFNLPRKAMPMFVTSFSRKWDQTHYPFKFQIRKRNEKNKFRKQTQKLDGGFYYQFTTIPVLKTWHSRGITQYESNSFGSYKQSCHKFESLQIY